MELDNPAQKFEEQNINPDELKNLLIGFIGQTYRDVSEFDKNLVQANATLAPKKQEFQNIAQKLINEVDSMKNKTVAPSTGATVPVPTFPKLPVQLHTVTTTQTTGFDSHPDQLEFNFDRSATAQTIQNSLDDISKRLKLVENVLDELVAIAKKGKDTNFFQ